MGAPLACIVCGKEPEPCWDVLKDDEPAQPHRATTFSSHGQYGSTAFDAMNGDQIEVNICDEHLVEHPSRVAFYRYTPPTESDYKYVQRGIPEHG